MFKDVYAKLFHSIEFFNMFLQSDNELLVPEMQKKLGVTAFVSNIKRLGNYPDFDKLPHLTQHGLQGFIVKNIEGESTEANDLSLVLKKWVCCVNNSKFYQRFHRTSSFKRHLKASPQ